MPATSIDETLLNGPSASPLISSHPPDDVRSTMCRGVRVVVVLQVEPHLVDVFGSEKLIASNSRVQPGGAYGAGEKARAAERHDVPQFRPVWDLPDARICTARVFSASGIAEHDEPI